MMGVGCGGVTPTCQITSCDGQGLCVTTLAGNWTGRFGSTGQLGLSFAVTPDGRVANLVISDSLSGGCGSTGLLDATGSLAALAQDGSFMTSYSGCNASGVCLSGTVRGTVTATGATGTFSTTGTSSLSPLCFGSVSGSSTAWQAARDCSLRPSTGGSATRFCDAAGVPIAMPTDPSADACSPCGPGSVLCSAQCIDPASDAAHCGATLGCGARLGGSTGIRCASGQVCAQGACIACTVREEFVSNLAVAGNPSWFDTGDVDGDGDVDVVYAETTASGTNVGTSAFLNQGRFTFGAATVLTNKVLRSLKALDLNGDNKTDLVGIDNATQTTIVSFLGDGTGAFTAGPTQSCGTDRYCREIAVADLNEDGLPDIAAVTERSLLSSAGQNQLVVFNAPAFTPVSYAIGASGSLTASPGPIAAKDLNRDNHVDLVVLVRPATIYVLINKGDGSGGLTGLAAATIPKSVAGDLRFPAVGDLDGDGNPDLLFGNAAAGVLAFGTGDGIFPVTQEISGLAASAYALADLRANGRTQIVSGPQLSVRELSTRSTVQTLWSTSRSAADVALRDVDGDGRSDVIARGSGGLDVYRNVVCP
jgi:hypothetical protein